MAKPKVVLIGETYSPRSYDAEIDVYITSKPSVEYIEFAKIECNDTNDEWNLNQIKMKAREIGADGVIKIGKASSGSFGVPVGTGMYSYFNESYGMNAVAIKYK